MENKCPICKEPAIRKCSACHLVSYCSPAHQQQHWKTHRKNCTSFVVKVDPELGHGFYASRNLKAGDIILIEKAAVQSPGWNQPRFSTVPFCVTCGMLLTMQSTKMCSKCRWPVCSQDCEEFSIHADNECKIFSAQKIPYPPPGAFKLVQLEIVIMLMRVCFLKTKKPDIYEKILQLQSQPSFGELDFSGWVDKSTLRKLLMIPESVGINDAEIMKLIKIFRINCHTIIFGHDESEIAVFPTPSLGYLYIMASRMNHSCVPNCSWIISGKPEFNVRIKTALPVKKGEALTINYYMIDRSYGTKQRQEFIRKGGFLCKCVRCKDPTELGTFMSAIICSCCKGASSPKPLTGYLLPEDPLDLNDSAPWKCSHCGNVKLALEILPKVEKIGKMISKKEKEIGNNSDADSCNSLLSFCKNVVSKYSGKSLHPNHWVLQEATGAVFRYLTTHLMNKMDLELSQHYVKCGMYLLSIQDVISPGLSPNRAHLQLKLSTALNDQIPELCTLGNHEEERTHLQVQVSTALDEQIRELDTFEKEEEAISKLIQIMALQREAFQFFQTKLPNANGSNSKDDTLKHSKKDPAGGKRAGA